MQGTVKKKIKAKYKKVEIKGEFNLEKCIA